MKFLYPEGKKKALTFSYDDGQKFDVKLAQIFRDHGMKCTFNLNSSNITDAPDSIYVNINELDKIYEGHEIAAHGLEHKAMTNITDQALVIEVMEDRRNLEKLFGRVITGMAYAFGAYNSHVIELLRSMGVKYSRTCGTNQYFDVPADFLEWHSTCHHSDNLIAKGKEFLECPDWKELPLMYVWGHSYEFGYPDDWSEIEEFTDMMQGKNDIWYATNGEICDYITAIRRLEYSADGKRVSNPSALAIYYQDKDKNVKAIPGGASSFEI